TEGCAAPAILPRRQRSGKGNHRAHFGARGGGVTRLLIAAGSQLMREGLERLAASSPSFEIIGSFRDLSAVEVLRPDLVLAALPREDIVPAPAIVWLTESARPEWSRELLRSGVRAVLPRDASPAEILAALETAASGMAVIDPRDLEPLLP